MRALGIAVVVAALLAACGEENAGGAPRPAVAPLPIAGGVARFVIVPPEGGPSWLPELPIHVVFEGPEPTFGLVWPEDFTALRAIGPGEATAAGGRAFADVMRDGWNLLEFPPPETPTLSFPRIELLPVDVDRDGIADRLEGTFTVIAEFMSDDFHETTPAFTARAEAAIVPASLGLPRFAPQWFQGDAAAPCDSIRLRFDLPARVESARLVTASGEIPVAWPESNARHLHFWPDQLVPWGGTIRLVGEARVLGAGAALEPFEVDIPVWPGPAAPWSASFEANDLDGLVLTHGNVTLADASDGLPALDGDRFLLADNGAFGFLFEIDVPDTEAPTLRLDARFAYRGEAGGPTSICEVVAAAAGGRTSRDFGFFNPRTATALEGGAYAAVSATQQVELPLATLRGRRAVIAVRGFRAGTRDEPAADGRLQLDGLRVVP